MGVEEGGWRKVRKEEGGRVGVGERRERERREEGGGRREREGGRESREGANVAPTLQYFWPRRCID